MELANTTTLIMEFRLGYLTVLCFILAGCFGEKNNTYYADGKLNCSSEMRDRKRNGEARCFYPSGRLKSIDHYKNDKLHGVSEEYFENGNVELRTRWNEGVIIGFAEQYYSNGNLFLKTYYKNGFKTGEIWEYHTSGKLASRIIADSLRNAIYRMSWKENGEKQQGKVIPIVKVVNDTIDVDGSCYIKVAFGYRLTGDINIDFDGLDSLKGPKIDYTKNVQNEFSFVLKFEDSGLHSFVLTVNHNPVPGDTLSADDMGQVINVYVKPLLQRAS